MNHCARWKRLLNPFHSARKLEYFAYLLAFIIICSVYTIRAVHEDSVPIGNEAYYHLDMAQQILEDRTFVYNPFHLLIAFVAFIIGYKAAWLLLPVIFTFLLVWLLQFFLKELNFDDKERFMINVFFMLSPIFILFSTTLNVYFFTFALMLGGLLYCSRNDLKKANILFAIASLASLYAGLVLAGFLLVYYTRNKNKDVIYSVIISLFSAVISWETVPMNHGVTNLVTDLIGDLGGLFGFNIYIIILFFIGFELSWDYKANLAYVYIFLLGLFILAVTYNLSLNAFLLLPVCMFAVYGFMYLMEREWYSHLIRDLILLTLIAGLVISGINSIKQVSYAEPSSGIYDSLAGLKTYASEPEIVFSYYDRSAWIESIARMPSLYDFQNKGEEITQNIFLSKNFENVIQFLKDNHVRYIWFDEKLKKQFWSDRDKGLLFFLNNRDNFEQVYADNSAELWKFIGDIPVSEQ